MTELLSLLLVYSLMGATVFMAVALFVSIIRENDKEKMLYPKQVVCKPPKYGLTRWELNRAVKQVLKQDRRRAYKIGRINNI